MKGVHTKYKAFSKVDITADIGLYIGLRGINVTLKGRLFCHYVDCLLAGLNFRCTGISAQ